MADVKIVDIDGEQWSIKDQESREKIAEIEENISSQDLPDVPVGMKTGYTCKKVYINNHYKVGKIHFATFRIENLSGSEVGGTRDILIASTNLTPIKHTTFIARDYKTPATVRGVLSPNGDISFGECNGIVDGNNVILGELIFAEM